MNKLTTYSIVDTTFHWKGGIFNTRTSRLRIFPNQGKHVVMFTELKDNKGHDVMNDAERLATQVLRDYGLDAQFVLWIEHHPSDQVFENETYDLIQFNWDGSKFSQPRKLRLTFDEVNCLCGREVAPTIGWKRVAERQYAAYLAWKTMKSSILSVVFLDTETTGLEGDDEIVDIALLDASGTVLLDTLVKPVKSIPTAATAVHGITNADVGRAPTIAELAPQIETILSKHSILAIYNADYDIRMLWQSLKERKLENSSLAKHLEFFLFFKEVCCVMKLYAQFYGEWSNKYNSFAWQPLEKAARQCGIAVPSGLHRAHTDAELARQVMIYMAAQAKKFIKNDPSSLRSYELIIQTEFDEASEEAQRLAAVGWYGPDREWN